MVVVVGPARPALEGRDRGRGDRRLEDLLADEAGEQDAEAGDLDHDQRPHEGMESGRAVALAELVIGVPAQAVVDVGGDRATKKAITAKAAIRLTAVLQPESSTNIAIKSVANE